MNRFVPDRGKRLSLFSGCLAASILLSGAAAAANWNWLDKANYPAHVAAINFANGNNLTRTSSVTYGSWDVSFGPAPSTATFMEGYGNERVTVSGLQCKNSIAGSLGCNMVLGHSDKYDEARCQIFADAGGSDFPGINIDCPSGLDFAP